MQLVKVKFKSEVIEVIDNLVSINAICKNLGIDRKAQQSKIQSDKSFESQFKEIEINGIFQKVLCIPYDKVNGWLFSINPNKVKPEVKEHLIRYKKECFDVLYKHFNPQTRTNPYVINGYKSQLAQHQKKIKLLENKLLDYPRAQKPRFVDKDFLQDNWTFNKKLNFLLKQTEQELESNPKNKWSFFQNRSNYFITYIKCMRQGGNELQRFTSQLIEDAQKRRNEAENKYQELKDEHENLKNAIKNLKNIL